MQPKDSYKKVRKILLMLLLLNIFVALSKIIYGMATRTSSMVADGYHSLSDGASNIVGIIGVWIASKPADEKHPYGHHKFETLSTITISLFLFFVAYEILTGAYERFRNPVMPDINVLSFVVMLVTIGINIFITTYETRKGKELKSSILLSDAKHTKSDIYTSISVIIGLIAIRFGFVIVDTIIAGVIAILIVKAGLEILLPSIDVLSDANVMDINEIHKLVMNIPEVIYCHRIRTRGKEDSVMVDLHVGIDENFSLKYSHVLAHSIEDMLKHKLDGIKEVIVHVEPATVQISLTDAEEDERKPK